ncbi:MAG: hypothetical protein KGL46_10230 [Hyphomicrobiales bacterium]|nr:hypothetical protein [Hyphomicrobiales bacterium]
MMRAHRLADHLQRFDLPEIAAPPAAPSLPAPEHHANDEPHFVEAEAGEAVDEFAAPTAPAAPPEPDWRGLGEQLLHRLDKNIDQALALLVEMTETILAPFVTQAARAPLMAAFAESVRAVADARDARALKISAPQAMIEGLKSAGAFGDLDVRYEESDTPDVVASIDKSVVVLRLAAFAKALNEYEQSRHVR